MRFERIRSADVVGVQDGMVCVSRDEDDARRLWVDARELFGFHVARRCGGRKALLSVPMRAAVMWCSSIPAGVEFGHSCSHGPAPHAIKVLIREEV